MTTEAEFDAMTNEQFEAHPDTPEKRDYIAGLYRDHIADLHRAANTRKDQTP